MSNQSARAENSPLEKMTPLRSPTHTPKAHETSPGLFSLDAIQQGAGNLAIQNLLQTGMIHAKLSVTQPNDPEEEEADRIAEQIVSSSSHPIIQRKCELCSSGELCKQCEAPPIHRKIQGSSGKTYSFASEKPTEGLGSGRPLDPSIRELMESRFGVDFGSVRVHTESKASRSAEKINALAYTTGQNIIFADGRYVPGSEQGQKLLAHELVHTLQQRNRAAVIMRDVHDPPELIPDALNIETAVVEISRAVRETESDDNVSRVVSRLRGRSSSDLRSLRTSIYQETNRYLEEWFSFYIHIHRQVAAAEEGVRLLWRVLPLLDRLEFYDVGSSEIEQAQLDVIRAASREERDLALGEESRLNAIYSKLSPTEEYEARLLFKPEQSYDATKHLISRAEGIFSDEEAAVFNAIMNLEHSDRVLTWNAQRDTLRDFLSLPQLSLVETLSLGSEAEVLVARLRLATEGIDDQEGINTVVERAAAVLQQERLLRAALQSESLNLDDRSTLESELQELGNLKALLNFDRTEGSLDGASFLGRLVSASDSPEQFGAFARRLGADPFETAKQQILMSEGVIGADGDSIRSAILNLHAPPINPEPGLSVIELEQRQAEADTQLRHKLLSDREVQAVIGRLPGREETRIQSLAQSDSFDEILEQFNDALNAANFGELFRITLIIARRLDWRMQFQASAREPLSPYSRVFGEPREIVEEIIRTQGVPIARVLNYSNDIDLLNATFSQLDEGERGQLRLGYYLSREQRPLVTLSDEEREALLFFEGFETHARESLDQAELQRFLATTLDTLPSSPEMETDQGLFRAAAIMFHQQQERLALERGGSILFTESDEVMIAAAREFDALWEQVRGTGRLSATDFAILASLHDRFQSRSEEFTGASQSITDMAAIIAATAAGIVVIAITGGTATPAVVAAAATGGAGAGLVTREMFGADYYNALSSEGARNTLLDAINGALAVVGSSLGARGVELLGLSGPTLTSRAARLGVEVTEQAAAQATRSLGRQVVVSAVEATIDGAFSGFVSEGIASFTDVRTWRRGVWQGLVQVGQTALVGGLFGLGTGALLGSAMPILGRGARAIFGESIERTVEQAGELETLRAFRRSAQSGDLEEARRLFYQLRDHVNTQQADALWREAAESLEGHPLAEVTTGITDHHITICEGRRALCLCSDTPCSPLRRVIVNLQERLAETGLTSPQLTNLLTQADDAIRRADALITPEGRIPSDERLRESLQAAINRLEAVANAGNLEDITLRGIASAVDKPRLADALLLEGKTIEEVLENDGLSEIFNRGYTVYQSPPRIRRARGNFANYPRLVEETIQDPIRGTRNILRIAGDILPQRLQIEAAHLGSIDTLERHLAANSQAFTAYRDAISNNIPELNGRTGRQLIEDELETLRLEAREAIHQNRLVYLDNMRHNFHVRTREFVLNWMFNGTTAAGVHARFLQFSRNLNPAYLGSFGEHYYFRLRAAGGEFLIRHPRLLERPGSIDRIPDIGQFSEENLFITRPAELGDVKATGVGLNPHDIQQIEEILRSIHMRMSGARGMVGGAESSFTQFRLVFLNPEGAVRSAETINGWFRRYPRLTIEVIDAAGQPQVLNVVQWRVLGATESKLEQQLRVWTRSRAR